MINYNSYRTRLFAVFLVLLMAITVVISPNSVATTKDGDTATKGVAIKPEEVAIDFIKEVYSDVRSIDQIDKFYQRVDEMVATDNLEFRQILKDRKYIRDQFIYYTDMKVELKEHTFDNPVIVTSDSNSLVFTVNGTYKYIDAGGSGPLIDNSEDPILLGQVVPYAVSMEKDNGKWKVKSITSGDLTAAYMYEGLDTYSSKSGEAVLNLLLNGYDSYRDYNVEGIVADIIKMSNGPENNGQQVAIRDDNRSSLKSSVNSIRSTSQAFSDAERAYMRQYQRTWWNGYNPAYSVFQGVDCANYASQVLRSSGCPYGDYLPWYPYTSSWINVGALRNFILANSTAYGGAGPYGYLIGSMGNLDSGDLIQKANEHTFSVFCPSGDGYPYVTAHTNPRFDKINRILSYYQLLQFNTYVQVLGYTNM